MAADLDRGAIIGYEGAQEYLNHDGVSDVIYVRAYPEHIHDVRSVMAATVRPGKPDEVLVSRASDVLEARVAARSTFTNLFVGLGAVALLVGGVGIANVMVIAVMERCNKIGLRRALGATRFPSPLKSCLSRYCCPVSGGSQELSWEYWPLLSMLPCKTGPWSYLDMW